MNNVAIKFGNVTPNAAEVDLETVIDCWLEVETFFCDYELQIHFNSPIKVKLDSSLVRAKLHWLKPENCDEYLSLYFSKEKGVKPDDLLKNNPFGAELFIDFIQEPDDELYNRIAFVKKFLEQLFLAMNISKRGGCNYHSISIQGEKESYVLSCDLIENGWHKAKTVGWPVLYEMKFSEAWKWLERNSGLTYLMADTPATKAIATLMHLSYKDDIEATDVIQLSQVMESFFLTKGEPKARGLSKKIPVALGKLPEIGNRWIADFYKFRSDIAHGDFPVFRPRYREMDKQFEAVSKRYWEISAAIDFGVSVLIATIQNMIKCDADYYTFSEEIIVHPMKSNRHTGT